MSIDPTTSEQRKWGHYKIVPLNYTSNQVANRIGNKIKPDIIRDVLTALDWPYTSERALIGHIEDEKEIPVICRAYIADREVVGGYQGIEVALLSFCEEAVQVSKTLYTHPILNRKFRIKGNS